MMTFLLQKNKIPYDFQNLLIESQEYWNYRNKGKPEELQTRVEVFSEGDNIPAGERYCPVGSVEFFEHHLGFHPIPHNIPDSLIEFFPGRLWKNGKELKTTRDPNVDIVPGMYMRKSMTTIKDPDNGVTYNLKGIGQETEWIDDVESEWRCFIHGGKMVDARQYNYRVSPFSPSPSLEVVGRMISVLPMTPGLTLDIGVTSSGITFPIEVHDFFSCGLYGFSDLSLFPFMLWRTYIYLYDNKNKIN